VGPEANPWQWFPGRSLSVAEGNYCGVCIEFTFLCHWWSGSDCTVCVEKESDLEMIGKEHVITLMNHKYDIDWLMAWILAERLQMLGVTKQFYDL